MEYRELSTDCPTDGSVRHAEADRTKQEFPAKAQRRREPETIFGKTLSSMQRPPRREKTRMAQPSPLFAPLRLCGKHYLNWACVILLINLLSVLSLTAQNRRAMAPADILRVDSVSDAQISPNAQLVAYTVSSIETERAISTLWLARIGVDQALNPTSRATSSPQAANLRMISSRTLVVRRPPRGRPRVIHR